MDEGACEVRNEVGQNAGSAQSVESVLHSAASGLVVVFAGGNGGDNVGQRLDVLDFGDFSARTP